MFIECHPARQAKAVRRQDTVPLTTSEQALEYGSTKIGTQTLPSKEVGRHPLCQGEASSASAFPRRSAPPSRAPRDTGTSHKAGCQILTQRRKLFVAVPTFQGVLFFSKPFKAFPETCRFRYLSMTTDSEVLPEKVAVKSMHRRQALAEGMKKRRGRRACLVLGA